MPSDDPTRSTGLPVEDTGPIFDKGKHEDFPFPQDDVLPIDDDGSILPGNDPADEDPNDNGDQERNGPTGHRPDVHRID